MKILISKTALKTHSRSAPAHAGYTTSQFSWRDKLGEYVGQWVTVETEFLFEDQFNVVEGNLRIDANLCDDIDFEEIGSFDNYKEIVAKRYAKDWPGSKLKFIAIRQILQRAGKEDVNSIYKERGYDMEGKAI